MQQNLTSGSVFQNVVRFSLPYLLSYFLQTLYGMADLFIVGQFEGVASDDRRLHRLPGDAHAHRDARRPCHGHNRQHRRRRWAQETDRRAAPGIGNTVTLFMGLSAGC